MSMKRQKSGNVKQAVPAQPKFYNGPTVTKSTMSSNAGNAVKPKEQGKTKAVAPKIVVDVKGMKHNQLSRSAGSSHTGLNLFILGFFLVSFLSLSFCPSPTEIDKSVTRSYFNLNNLNPFSSSDSSIPAWERHVCEPTTAYRRHILEPYVIPHLQNRIHKIRANPIVKDHVEPAYHNIEFRTRQQRRSIQLKSQRLHSRFIKPYVPHVHRAVTQLTQQAQRITLQLWQRLLDLVAQFQKVASPYTQHPQVVRARKAATDIYNHPTVDTVQKHAHFAYRKSLPHLHRAGRYGSQKGVQSYEWTKKTGVPQAARGAVRALDLAEVKLRQLMLFITQLFNTHVHPILHPHYKTHVEPKISALTSTSYTPIIKKHVNRAVPLVGSLLLAPSLEDIRGGLKGYYESAKDNLDVAATNVKEGAYAVKNNVADAVSQASVQISSTGSVAGASAESVAYRAAASAKSVTNNVRKTAESATTQAKASASSANNQAIRAATSGSSAVSASVKSASKEVQVTASSIAASAASAGGVVSSVASSVATEAANQVIYATDAAKQAAYAASASGASAVNSGAASVASLSQQATNQASSVSESAGSAASIVASSASAAAAAATSTVESVVAQIEPSVSSVSVEAVQTITDGTSRLQATGSSASAVASSYAAGVTQQAHGSASSASSVIGNVASQAAASATSAASQVIGGANSISASGSSGLEQIASQTVSAARKFKNTASSVSSLAVESAVSATSVAGSASGEVHSQLQSAAGQIVDSASQISGSATYIATETVTSRIPRASAAIVVEPIEGVVVQDHVLQRGSDAREQVIEQAVVSGDDAEGRPSELIEKY